MTERPRKLGLSSLSFGEQHPFVAYNLAWELVLKMFRRVVLNVDAYVRTVVRYGGGLGGDGFNGLVLQFLSP